MTTVGLVVTTHSSNKFRPYGRDLLNDTYESFSKFCNYDYKIIVIDNQSDNRLLDNSKIVSDKHVIYHFVEDQYKRGITGAWNLGISLASEIGCDIILNSNDDIIFNDSINDFINNMMTNHHKDISIFAPLTNGVNGPFVRTQYSQGVNPSMSKEIQENGWEGVVSGFFFGFTKKFYQNFSYSTGDLFAEFDKFDKLHIHKYAGDDGKWAGQEMEILRFKEHGGRVFIIGECWVNHIKNRDWKKVRESTGEYGWHLKENFDV